MDPAQQPAKTAAAVAFIRAQERSSSGLGHRVTISSSRGRGYRNLPHQNNLGTGTRDVLRRRQSVRFVNEDAEKQSATTGTSTRILLEPKPGLATIRTHTTPPRTPSAYRPVSPVSSLGKDSAASEAPGSISRTREHTEYFIHEDDVLSIQSVRYGVRKAKSMAMPPKSSDSFYIIGAPQTSLGPSYSHGHGISNISMPPAPSEQISLRTHKSTNFLKLARSQSSSGRLSSDIRVQIARDKFLHQTNQQRLRERPSFLFRGKSWRQDFMSHSSRESDDIEQGAMLSWRDSTLRGKAHRAANKIRKKFRRVFGRSIKAPVDIPCQQVEAAESHAQEDIGADAQDSSSDSDASSSPNRLNVPASLGSYKNMTIRLVPPTPKRLPIYQVSQEYEIPQEVPYSDSIYSSGRSSTILELTSSSLTLQVHDDCQPNTGSVIILETVTYDPLKPKDITCASSSFNDPEMLMPWIGSEVESLETDQDDRSSDAVYINNAPVRTRYVAYGHVRESAQINDDDTAVAQEPITIKQPLRELQYNVRQNLKPASMCKSTAKPTSASHLAENVGFDQFNPPPPPPLPAQEPRMATDLGPRRSVTIPLIPSDPLRCDEKLSLSGSLADIIISSRVQDPSPSPCKIPAIPRPNSDLVRLPLNFHSEEPVEVKNKSTKTPAHERLWKVEPPRHNWYANDTLRSMLVERGNSKRRISVPGMPSTPNSIQDKSKDSTTNELEIRQNERENTEPQVEDRDEDMYEAEGAGLMGPSMTSRNNRLVGSLLSSRRSRITGCSDSDSEDAFI